MSTSPSLRALLALRGFRRLLATRLLSQFSDGVFQAALAAYVVFSPERQPTPTAIASAFAVLLLPFSVVGPFAGVLLDRWRRRQVLVRGNLLRLVFCLGTAALVAAKAPTAVFFIAALAVTGVNRFVLSGLSAALPHVVTDNLLIGANSLAPTAGTLAATVGAAARSWSGWGCPPGRGATRCWSASPGSDTPPQRWRPPPWARTRSGPTGPSWTRRRGPPSAAPSWTPHADWSTASGTCWASGGPLPARSGRSRSAGSVTGCCWSSC